MTTSSKTSTTTTPKTAWGKGTIAHLCGSSPQTKASVSTTKEMTKLQRFALNGRVSFEEIMRVFSTSRRNIHDMPTETVDQALFDFYSEQARILSTTESFLGFGAETLLERLLSRAREVLTVRCKTELEKTISQSKNFATWLIADGEMKKSDIGDMMELVEAKATLSKLEHMTLEELSCTCFYLGLFGWVTFSK
jgi:hypothetical protein